MWTAFTVLKCLLIQFAVVIFLSSLIRARGRIRRNPTVAQCRHAGWSGRREDPRPEGLRPTQLVRPRSLDALADSIASWPLASSDDEFLLVPGIRTRHPDSIPPQRSSPSEAGFSGSGPVLKQPLAS